MILFVHVPLDAPIDGLFRERGDVAWWVRVRVWGAGLRAREGVSLWDVR
jgi:hypothetical protein